MGLVSWVTICENITISQKYKFSEGYVLVPTYVECIDTTTNILSVEKPSQTNTTKEWWKFW